MTNMYIYKECIHSKVYVHTQKHVYIMRNIYMHHEHILYQEDNNKYLYVRTRGS